MFGAFVAWFWEQFVTGDLRFVHVGGSCLVCQRRRDELADTIATALKEMGR